jgi:hypothetical protein
MGKEMIPETSEIFNRVKRLIAGKEFINVRRCEGFRS